MFNIRKIFINYCNSLNENEEIFKYYTNHDKPFGDTSSLAYNIKELFLHVTNRSRSKSLDECVKLINEFIKTEEFSNLKYAPNLTMLFKRWFVIHDLRVYNNVFYTSLKRISTGEELFNSCANKQVTDVLLDLITNLTFLKTPGEMEKYINSYAFPVPVEKKITVFGLNSDAQIVFRSDNFEEFRQKVIELLSKYVTDEPIAKPIDPKIDMGLIEKIGDKDITELALKKTRDYEFSLDSYNEWISYKARYDYIKSGEEAPSFNYLESLVDFFTDNRVKVMVLD